MPELLYMYSTYTTPDKPLKATRSTLFVIIFIFIFLIDTSTLFLSMVSCAIATTTLGQWDWAAQVLEVRAELGKRKSQCINGRSDDTVEVAGDIAGGKLVQQARCISWGDGSGDRAVLDGAEVQGIEGSSRSVATEQDWVKEVHLKDLGGHV